MFVRQSLEYPKNYDMFMSVVTAIFFLHPLYWTSFCYEVLVCQWNNLIVINLRHIHTYSVYCNNLPYNFYKILLNIFSGMRYCTRSSKWIEMEIDVQIWLLSLYVHSDQSWWTEIEERKKKKSVEQ